MSALRDDPRLTAYALGELAHEERAAFEAQLADDPAAQAEVDEIRALAALLSAELGAEAAPAPDAALREVVVDGPSARRWWVAGGAGAALAASLALFLVSQSAHDAEPPRGAAVERASAASVASASADLDSDRSQADRSAKARPRLAANTERPRIQTTPRAAAASAASASAAPEPVPVAPATGAPVPTAGEQAGTKALPANPDPAFAWEQAGADAHAGLIGDVLVDQDGSGDTARFRGNKAIATGLVGGEANLAGRGKGGLIGVPLQMATEARGADRFDPHPENPFKQPTVEPLSTFSIDVDTASYSMVRSMLTQGRRPPVGAVRIEELLNYFEYDYAPPTGDVPFATHVEVASAPWAPSHRLVRVGLKGMRVDRPRANLVFLIDVSGSMSARNKLPLLKESMKTLVDSLHPDDRVAIVVYAGAAGLVLPSTPAKQKQQILGALDRLKSGGSTNGGAGIEQAYWVAAQHFIQGGVNRVIIGTDGDFNVGVTHRQSLIEMVEDRARGGIALTVLGFGMGNYNDATLEQLADKGDGNYAYIDTPEEGRKVLVDQLEGTLVTIAKDVKIQVEFNPAKVAAYRLIGYENRTMAARDFNDDTKDAGEIGAGHTVTALYEIVPTGHPDGRPLVDPLKYQARPEPAPTSAELLTLKLRYKAPTGGPSRLLSAPLIDAGGGFADASSDLRFAASVAAFGMILRHSPHVGGATLQQVYGWAEGALGTDPWGYRRGFLDLVRAATRGLR